MSNLEPKLENLKNRFRIYLNAKGVSQKTIRNYISDVNHFEKWWSGHISQFPTLSSELFSNYKHFLSAANSPKSTSNRRLSTIRSFGEFLYVEKITSTDFSKDLSNFKTESESDESLRKYIPEFKKFLAREKVTNTTIKNYLSDVRQFANWLEGGTYGRS